MLYTPDATQALYVVLYAVTLALHGVLVGAVVGGTGYALVAAVRGRPDPIAEAARGWLPVGLGLAITAGVAPLLFVQLLYQDSFYTANLLRGPRWLAMVPALGLGFLLLYLHKAGWGRRAWQRGAVLALALGCFGFVAWSWSTNHQLMQAEPWWRNVYQHGKGAWPATGRWPRLLMWGALALPLFAAVASSLLPSSESAARRRLAALALVGLVGAGAAAVVAYRSIPDWVDQAWVRDTPWLPWLGVAAGVLVLAWAIRLVRPSVRWVGGAIWGATAALSGCGVMVREAERASRLWALRPRVAQAEGFGAFLLMLVIATAAIAWVVRLARRAPPA
jgi:hypothetical protein